jgi:hypothetical protein
MAARRAAPLRIKPLDPRIDDTPISPDGASFFAYRVWESTAAVTDDYPAGYRYRLIARSNVGASRILLSVWIQVSGTPALAVARYEVSPSVFAKSVRLLLAAIERCHGVSFTSGDALTNPSARPRVQ